LGQAIGTNAITQGEYFQLGNTKTTYRFGHIPDSKNDLDLLSTFSAVNAIDELYVLVISGTGINRGTVGKVDISYDYEYIPSFTN